MADGGGSSGDAREEEANGAAVCAPGLVVPAGETSGNDEAILGRIAGCVDRVATLRTLYDKWQKFHRIEERLVARVGEVTRHKSNIIQRMKALGKD